jgi:hypothetical protein
MLIKLLTLLNIINVTSLNRHRAMDNVLRVNNCNNVRNEEWCLLGCYAVWLL